jgi:prepilin-type N-terminal cleavage/methylation domain-containing protein
MQHGIQNRVAFTLIELVMVVTIVAVLALAAIPFITDDSAHAADLEGARMESTLQHARALALSRCAEFRVTFTDVKGKSTVTLERVQSGPVDPQLAADDYAWTLEKGLFDTVNCDGGSEIVFDATGKAKQGGTLVLAYGTRKYTLSITAVTGCAVFSEGGP